MLRHVSRLAILALVSAAVHAQTLDKVIPLGSIGSNVRHPWLAALDTATNRLFVGDDDAGAVVILDCSSRERVACLQTGEGDWCLSLFTVPGRDRVCVVAPYTVSFIEATTCSLAAQFGSGGVFSEYFGGGCNPATGKVYCAFEDSLLVFDGASCELIARVEIGWADDYDEWMPFAASPASNKVYLYVYEDPADWTGVVAVDGAGDSIVARLSLGPDGWVGAMCYDDRNDMVWCGVVDSVSRILGIDCRADSIVADICFGEDSYPITMTYDRVLDRVYCATDEYELVVVDAGARSLRRVEDSRGWIAAMAISEQSRELYCTDEGAGKLRVYDLEWEQFVDEVEGFDWPVALAWNPLGNEFCCLDNELATVTFVAAEVDSVVAETSTWAVPHSPVLDSANRRLYLVGPDPDVVSVVDTRDDVLVGEVDVGFGITTLCWCESSQRLFAGGSGADSVAVVDPARMQVVGTLRVHDPDTLLTYGDRVYCCSSADSGVTVLAGDGSGVLGTIPLGFRMGGCLLSRESRRLYVADRSDSGLAVVDLVTNSQVAVLPIEGSGHGLLAELPAEGRLYCRSGKFLLAYDTRTLSPRGVLDLGEYPQALLADQAGGRVFCGLPTRELVSVDPRGDTVAGRLHLPEEADVLCLDRNSGLVCWVGDSLVGFVDARTLEERGTLPVSGLRSYAACDEAGGRVYSLTMSSVVAVRGPEPGPRLRSATGPSLVGRTIRLYGTADAALHDVAGRRMMTLVPGENRLVGLVPGTYFLVHQGRGGAQKVVLPR